MEQQFIIHINKHENLPDKHQSITELCVKKDKQTKM